MTAVSPDGGRGAPQWASPYSGTAPITPSPTAVIHLYPSPLGSLPAARNGLPPPYPDAAAAREAYQFSDLQSFLDLYYNGAGWAVHAVHAVQYAAGRTVRTFCTCSSMCRAHLIIMLESPFWPSEFTPCICMIVFSAWDACYPTEAPPPRSYHTLLTLQQGVPCC